MRRFIAVLSLLSVAAACSDASLPITPEGESERTDLAPLYVAEQGWGRPGYYIVVFDGEAATTQVNAAARVHGARKVYHATVKGFAGPLNERQLTELRKNPHVAWVEQDGRVTIAATQGVNFATGGNWGLDRTDQRKRGLDTFYTYATTGTGVNVYVIDTGISPTHSQFVSNNVSRAAVAYDAMQDDGIDCNGHGTHVAGIIGGSIHGIAKNVNIKGVRVLDCNGVGWWSEVLAGIDWVRANAVRPAVANLSLSGGMSKTINVAIDRLNSANILPVAGVGNFDQNACDESPSAAVGAFGVGAVDSSDMRADFTNWGRCVHLYAPGVMIRSASLSNSTDVLSGTSMAAAHVTGVAALYLQSAPTATAANVRSWLINNGTANAVRQNDRGDVRYGTPNKLLFKPVAF